MAKNIECKLGHLGIRVTSLENSIKFYETNFGFQKIRESDKPDLRLRLATLQLEDSFLELLQPYTPTIKKLAIREEKLPDILEKTNSHIAFNVHSLADAYNQLIENNVKFAAEFNPSESKNLFCYDPDGFLIELKQK